MDVGRRAKQFAPFAALRGLDETIRQQEIIYEIKDPGIWDEDTGNLFS